MTEVEILQWIKKNLTSDIQKAIFDSGASIYTEDWLAGLICRETGGLISRYGISGKDIATIAALMRGDYSQRPGEPTKTYHGYGLIQIDINSYPAWVKTGAWKIPYKNFIKTITILDEKRNYILRHFPNEGGEALDRATTAAFNCGQGNVVKSLNQGNDVDEHTAGHNYSREVFRMRDVYMNL